jgi:hypothetical protein
MRAQTFDQLFNLRPNCPCGSKLITLVSRGNAIDDEYTFVAFVGSHHWSETNEGVSFLGNIGSNVTPYGQAEFLIKCSMNSSNFELIAAYDKQSPNTQLPADQFVKRHFNTEFQQKIKVFIKRECSNRGECRCHYSMSTSFLTFDMYEQTISPIEIEGESFWLEDNSNHRYFFKTSFKEGITSIRFVSPSPKYIIGEVDSMEIDADKFLRFPLEREFLLNKAKTFLLFS